MTTVAAPIDALSAALISDDLPPEILKASTEELSNRTKLLENDIKIMRSDQARLSHEQVLEGFEVNCILPFSDGYL